MLGQFLQVLHSQLLSILLGIELADGLIVGPKHYAAYHLKVGLEVGDEE